jgi:flagellar hook-basal body protein
MHSDATKTSQANIAAKNAWGTKKRETLFVESVVSSGGARGSGASYITTNTRSTNNVQGDIVATGLNSDLAIEGQGMFVVADSTTSSKLYTRRGDFRQDELGYWKNGAGYLLYANKLDRNEKPIKDMELLDSLSAVNFSDSKGNPKATTTLSIAMNLNSKQSLLKGPGIRAFVNKTGKNSSSSFARDGVLFSERTPSVGSLSIGDRFNFRASPPAFPKIFEYGGLAIGRAPTATNPIFGATDVGSKFTLRPVGAAPSNNTVADGSSLTITVGLESYTFTVSLAGADPQNKTFNSIRSLQQAINSVGGLNSGIDTNNNIYIAASNPNTSLTFTDTGQPGLKNLLGLADVQDINNLPPAPGGETIERFNSLYSLNQAINREQGTYKLSATIDGGALKINSLTSQDTFQVNGESLGVRSFSSATLGDGTEKGRAAIRITSAAHGLKTGDLLNMKGISGPGTLTPDGIYAVGTVDNDQFEIYCVTSTPGDTNQANAVLSANLAATALNPAANASWQKIPGQRFNSVQANITASAAGGATAGDDAGRVTITAPAVHNLVVGDVVWISGGGKYHVGANDIKLPDGYYVVQATGGGGATFDIKTYDTAAGVVFPAAGVLTYQKVGKVDNAGVSTAFTTPAGITTFDTTRLFSTATNGLAIGDNKVALHVSNHNYSAGEQISFQGLPVPYVIDGVTIRNDFNYVVDIASTADVIILQIPAGDGVIAAATGNGTYSSTANTPLIFNAGPDFRINNVNQLYKYFNSADSLLAGDIPPVPKLATYDANNPDKSLFGNLSLQGNGIDYYTVPISLYDSLGESFVLQLRFAKLSEVPTIRWAVEIGTVADANGVLDIVTPRRDGQIANGEITFDENGIFQTAGGLDIPIAGIKRKNGSADINLQIDWKNQLSSVKGTPISQNGSANNVELIQSDGQAAGNLVNLEVNDEGYIIGIFDSGEILKLYQIPLALFANVNGLRASVGGAFEVTGDSGDLLLKSAATGGAGKVLSGVLEAANVDTTEELLNLQDLSNDIRANARATNVTNKNIQTILSEIQ